MITRSFICIILFSLTTNLLNAQDPGRRWAKLFDNNEKTIYVDTTSIRQIDNQLSVWSLLIYAQPQQKENIDKDVKKIKTQYLINTLTKRYSIIGSLFYDDRGRIVGESSIARFGGSNNLTQMVAENPLVTLIMDAAKTYNETGTINFDENDPGRVEEYDESNENIPDDVTDYNRDIQNTESSRESDLTDEDSPVEDDASSRKRIRMTVVRIVNNRMILLLIRHTI
nr:surface-adhesin E family protein [uncultured Sphaerochaeta sp.]